MKKKSKLKSKLKIIFGLVMLISVALGVFAMAGCTNWPYVSPSDPNVHEVFFLANGGRIGGGHFETQLLFRGEPGAGRMSGGPQQINVPMRRGYNFLGWYEVDQARVHHTYVRRVTALEEINTYPYYEEFYVYERFMYLEGHNYMEIDTMNPISVADLESEIRFDRDIVEEGETRERIDNGEYLVTFRTGAEWDFDFDEIDISSYQVDDDGNQLLDNDGNPLWVEPRTVFIALWESRRQFVVLPRHSEWFRGLNPDDPNFDDYIASHSNNHIVDVLRRRNVRADGFVSYHVVRANTYNRAGFQPLGFFTDRQLSNPVVWNEAGLFDPGMEFVRDENGEFTDIPTTVVLFVDYISAGYTLIRSEADLRMAPGVYRLQDRSYYFAVREIDLGGGRLEMPAVFNNVIRGNGVTISNFYRVVNMRSATEPNAHYGGLFNVLGGSAAIERINFLNFTICFRHLNTTIGENANRVPVFVYDHEGNRIRVPVLNEQNEPVLDVDGNPVYQDKIEHRLVAYHNRPQNINAFAAYAYSTASASDVNISFHWRESLYQLTGMAGWWGPGWEHGQVPVYRDAVTPDNRYSVTGISRPDIPATPNLSAARELALPVYRLRQITRRTLDAYGNEIDTVIENGFLEFHQVGRHLGGYFEGIAGGLSRERQNLNAIYLGEVDVYRPLTLGVLIDEYTDLEIFNHMFEGVIGTGGAPFFGWFAFDLENAGPMHNHFFRFEIEVRNIGGEYVLVRRTARRVDEGQTYDFVSGEYRYVIEYIAVDRDDLNGLFILPMWFN